MLVSDTAFLNAHFLTFSYSFLAGFLLFNRVLHGLSVYQKLKNFNLIGESNFSFLFWGISPISALLEKGQSLIINF